MNRYKPVGWRNESYRHSLAARGISKNLRKSFVLVNAPEVIEPGKLGIRSVVKIEDVPAKVDVFFPSEDKNKEILEMPGVKEQLGGELSELGVEPLYSTSADEMHKERRREITREWRANMTPEEKEDYRSMHAQYNREWRANLTPEKREAYNEKQREYRRWRYQNMIENMSPEELEGFRGSKLEYDREKSANMTPEEREEENARQREWRANLTPEESEIYHAKRREWQREWRQRRRLGEE